MVPACGDCGGTGGKIIGFAGRPRPPAVPLSGGYGQGRGFGGTAGGCGDRGGGLSACGQGAKGAQRREARDRHASLSRWWSRFRSSAGRLRRHDRDVAARLRACPKARSSRIPAGRHRRSRCCSCSARPRRWRPSAAGEAFYYISQTAPSAATAVHAARRWPTSAWWRSISTRTGGWRRVASYGIRDGKVFDYISRTTPTAGADTNFIKGLFQNLGNAHIGLPF